MENSSYADNTWISSNDNQSLSDGTYDAFDQLAAFGNTSVINNATQEDQDGFISWYVHHVHGWLSIAVCIFGILANILNVMVLSRKNMISPTNAILIGLAVADMLVMCVYLPHAVMEYIPDKELDCVYNDTLISCQSYGIVLYTYIYSNAALVFHTVSTWLTVALAIWRWMAVTFPSQTRNVCSMKRALIAIISTYVGTFFACTLNYFSFTVQKVEAFSRFTGQLVDSYKLDTTHTGDDSARRMTRRLNIWIYSVLMKLVPCIALTLLSTALVKALCKADERRRRLQARPNGTGPGQGQEAPSNNQRSSDRTTRMLLAVLLLFLITEFPSGILGFISGCDENFFDTHYTRYGEIFDCLALINSSVNFILYCSMSRQFRKAFGVLFTPRWPQQWAPVMATEANATIATTCV